MQNFIIFLVKSVSIRSNESYRSIKKKIYSQNIIFFKKLPQKYLNGFWHFIIDTGQLSKAKGHGI